MKNRFIIKDQTVHIWRLLLNHFQEEHLRSILDSDELERADRFHFPIHRQRFTIARGLLRKILALYTNVAPDEIKLEYGYRGKPRLLNNNLLQFNISHSDEVAIVGLTVGHEIGVDVEKIENKYKDDVAKRFFSTEEYRALNALAVEDQTMGFYQLWTGKEAIIKALGEGLYAPLGSFTVSLNQKSQWVTILHNNQEKKYFLEYIPAFSGFESAFATDQEVKNVLYFEW